MALGPPPVSDALDLWLLSAPGDAALVLARHGGDIACTTLPLDAALDPLLDFRRRLDQSVRGYEPHPSPRDLAAFGRALFAFLIRGPVAELYSRLPAARLRLQIFSNHPELANLPWEFLQEPNRLEGPRRDRLVTRIVSAAGYQPPPAAPLADRTRVLFISAAPIDQGPVDFNAVRGAIEIAFRARLPERFTIDAVDGATPDGFRSALARIPADVLHFSGHGDVSPAGVGRLLLIDRRTRRTAYLEAPDLALLLTGLPLRLVILSACETATGDFRDDFSVLAAALIRSGIPAVVANQLPIPNLAVAPFVGALYDSLLQHGDIDLAVAEGRLALLTNLRSFEWGIPTLYRHYDAARIYQ